MDKAELIVFRVSPEEKQQFLEACKQKGITASEALRNFALEYVRGAKV